MSITYIVKGKRVWSSEAKNIIKKQNVEEAFEVFIYGLRESGFRKCGEYAGVERWSLGDTNLIVNINTNNHTFNLMNTKDRSIREVDVFFDLVRAKWTEMIKSFSTNP